MEPITAEAPPLPGRVILGQQWSELAYFHWPYEPETVQLHLPPGLRVDTFDGAAWVGLIPFEMRHVRLGPTPPMPWLGNFIEINVRTYVVDRLGRRAVWFFSLDVPRSLVVGVARSVFALPYCWARTDHEHHDNCHRYRMVRRWPRDTEARADLQFSVGDRLAASERGGLDHFLSDRWALVTTRRRRLLYGRVHHGPWPLHRIDDLSIDQSVIESAGLPTPAGPPHALYSPGVEVTLSWFDEVPPERA